MPTDRRAPPPPPGPASSRSAGGRGRARPARTAAGTTTCRCTCTSRSTPWFAEALLLAAAMLMRLGTALTFIGLIILVVFLVTFTADRADLRTLLAGAGLA